MKRKKVCSILVLGLAAACTFGVAGCGGSSGTAAGSGTANETGNGTAEDVGDDGNGTADDGSEAGGSGTDGSGSDTATSKDTENGQDESTYTVTFYDSDGETVLDTQEVAAGETAQEKAGEKEGYTFVGWFSTPNMKYPYDFSTPVTENLSLYGGFVTDQEDTREFYIVGNGESEVLKESAWGAVTGEAQKLTKADDSNTYTITVDLQEGDQFQFAINSSWEDQRGFGYLDTTSDGGTEYFKSDSGLGSADTSRMNIQVNVSGNYTFTLTTYPGEDEYLTDDPQYSESGKENFNINPYDTITWTYNGE